MKLRSLHENEYDDLDDEDEFDGEGRPSIIHHDAQIGGHTVTALTRNNKLRLVIDGVDINHLRCNQDEFLAQHDIIPTLQACLDVRNAIAHPGHAVGVRQTIGRHQDVQNDFEASIVDYGFSLKDCADQLEKHGRGGRAKLRLYKVAEKLHTCLVYYFGGQNPDIMECLDICDEVMTLMVNRPSPEEENDDDRTLEISKAETLSDRLLVEIHRLIRWHVQKGDLKQLAFGYFVQLADTIRRKLEPYGQWEIR